jgi:hypothetical protein
VESRRFNECDIIGELDRDEKGNVLVGEPDADGRYRDRAGAPTNERGYLIAPATGDVINNLNGEPMFIVEDLDERGEVPAPYNVEKHNFNAHQCRGDFDLDRNGHAVVNPGRGTVSGMSPTKGSMKGSPDKGSPTKGYADKRGTKVSRRGYRVDPAGNMLDNYGRKKFDRS